MMFGKDKARQDDPGPLYTAAANSAVRRADAWLEANLKRGAREKFSLVGMLTPELAEMLLARNPGNRNISKARIQQIATDLREGRVPCNGETIIISKCGMLNDGQHRSAAVVETGIGYETFFSFGVERDSRLTVDQGGARTGGDYLNMDGKEAGNTRAAIAGYLWQVAKYGELPQTPHAPNVRPTKAQVREAAEVYAREIDAARAAIPKEGTHRITSYTLICVAFICIARKAGFIAAEDFIRQLIKGANLSEQHPILLARNRMMDEKRLRTLWPHKAVEIMLRAWNATRSKRRYTKVQLHSRWPEIEV